MAAALSAGLAALLLQVGAGQPWLNTWRAIADLFASLVVVLFCLTLPALWLATALLRRRHRSAAGVADAPAPAQPPGRHLTRGWATLLLAVCLTELVTHAGPRNGFLASSRPESGVEAWTPADGYATLLDGVIAQGDGLFLLPLLRTFLDEAPPGPSEYDRRAGHPYLVSLLQRPLGTYWGFAGLNLLAWWGAALGVWWLAERYWSGPDVPWVAALLVATGHGFVFMGTAPQPHAVAFGAFVLLLVLAERLGLWRAGAGVATGAKVGWATGAAGLIYFVHLPALLAFWLYGLATSLTATRLRVLVALSVVAGAVLLAWQGFAGALLGLTFAGGNNEYTGEAIRSWLALLSRGPDVVLYQLHTGSLRGILVGAFPYPLWILGAAGLVASPPRARTWALAVAIAAVIPAIAFSTRFQLPRLAYFAFPAVYLLAAAGTVAIASALAGAGARRRALLCAVVVLLLAALTNLDLTGWQGLNVWFHYGQGNTW